MDKEVWKKVRELRIYFKNEDSWFEKTEDKSTFQNFLSYVTNKNKIKSTEIIPYLKIKFLKNAETDENYVYIYFEKYNVSGFF